MAAPYIPFGGLRDPVSDASIINAVVGDQVKIIGANFETHGGTSAVTLVAGLVEVAGIVNPINWSDAEILFIIPPDPPRTFSVRVTNNSGFSNNV